jgi:hypothetical protein
MLAKVQSEKHSTMMAQVGLGDVPSPFRASNTGQGTEVLDLVRRAAELFSEIEEQAREAETRAESVLQKLHSAEARIEVAEQSRREIIVEADSKLQAASRALDRAEREIIAAQEKATAAEVRAELAEIKAREALEALALVEQVIRKELLSRATTGDAAPVGGHLNPRRWITPTEQRRARLGELHEGAALVQGEPAVGNRNQT